MERASRWVLIALCVAALSMRLSGLERMLPHLPEPDSYLVLQAQVLREGREAHPKREKGYFAYPLLLARGLACLPEAKVEGAATLDEHLDATRADYVRARALAALLSAALVPLTYLVARRFLGSLGALAAAALVATSLLHLYFSQQARPHGPHASFALLGVIAALQLRRAPDWSAYLAATAMALLAVATLHNGVFVLLPIAAAAALRVRASARAPAWAVALPFAAALAAWLAFYPSLPASEDQGATIDTGGHTFYWRDVDGSGFAKCARVLWSYDPALAVLAAAGVAAALAMSRGLWRRATPAVRGDLAVVLAYALPYALLLGAYKETADRFLLPLLPFLALGAGFALERAGSPAPRVVQAGVVAAALAVPVFGVAQLARVRSTPDTVEQAARWLTQHARRDAEAIVVTPGIALPLASNADALDLVRDDYGSRQRAWLAYQLEHAPLAGVDAWPLYPMPARLIGRTESEGRDALVAFVTARTPRWIVIEHSRRMQIFPLVRVLRDWAREHGELAASIGGEDERRALEPPLDYQDVPRLFPRLARATAFGPRIEIWRVGGSHSSGR